MKQSLSIALLLCLLLCACTVPQDIPETSAPAVTDPTNEPSSEPSSEPTETPTEIPTTEATEPPPVYTNPLTGETLDAPLTTRPYAVMLNNLKAAMPQHGISQADILYEVLVEGGITRCMAVFTNVEDVKAIGSVRSSRKYYVDIAQSYDAIYVHAGGSDEAYSYMNSLRCEHLDGVKGASAMSYFYRDQERRNNGYSLEHTMFISGSKIVEYATNSKFTLTRSEAISYGYQFDADNSIAGQAASKVVVKFHRGTKPASNTKTTTLTYDADTKLYYAYQHGADYIDGNTKETVAFRNVLILRADTSLQSNGKLLTINTIGSGTGYYVCNGQMISIKWSRASLKEPFVYTLEDGTPLTFAIGTTYIAIVPQPSTVEFK